MLQMGLQVLHQLEALHAAGFVQADVKPSNIIWLEHKHRWVLIDYADSHTIDEQADWSATAEFAPPEALSASMAGTETVTYGTSFDLYGLAAVLWTEITGMRPYKPLFDRGLEAVNAGDDAVVKQVRGYGVDRAGPHAALLRVCRPCSLQKSSRAIVLADKGACREVACLADIAPTAQVPRAAASVSTNHAHFVGHTFCTACLDMASPMALHASWRARAGAGGVPVPLGGAHTCQRTEAARRAAEDARVYAVTRSGPAA
jgi:serine/threonine protein kinase